MKRRGFLMNGGVPNDMPMHVVQEVVAAAFAWLPEEREMDLITAIQMSMLGFIDGHQGKPWRKNKHNKREVWEAGALARHLETLGGQR